MSNIQFIDTTLREGFQGAITPFKNGITPAAYAEAAISNLNFAFAEIYGPDVYYPADTYNSIIQTLGQQLQLYCGVIDKFDASKKLHLKKLAAPRLSFTVIHKNAESVNKLQKVLATYPTATFRVGMECASSADKSDLVRTMQQLDGIEQVTNITLSDSNGTMTPSDIRKLIAELPPLKDATLGFHLHNDKGLALTNAITALEASAAAGYKDLSLDYTFYGLGERYGLLSLQELAASGQNIIIDKTQETIRKISELFSEEASRFHVLPYMKDVVHVAASHFDASGNLRPEYRTNN